MKQLWVCLFEENNQIKTLNSVLLQIPLIPERNHILKPQGELHGAFNKFPDFFFNRHLKLS